MFLSAALFAQDERRVSSPNGQTEFRLYIATQGNTNLSRIAYEVSYHGKPVIGMSFMGLDIYNQEPMLGENDGMTSSSSGKGSGYNSLTAKYMQNGSLGRLINVEVRAYDDGVAFRYVIPPSTPLTEILIAEEATEFHFVEGSGSVFHMITESKPGSFPPMHLIPMDQTTELTRLDRSGDRKIVFEGSTPLTCPWRIIALGPDRESALQSKVIADLKN